MSHPLLVAKNITVRLRTSLFFENTSWQIHPGEQWLIVGPNGAGKTTFAKALAGLVPLKFGEIVTKGKVSYVSFDTEQRFLEKEEQKKDFASFVGKEKKGKTVRAFLGSEVSQDFIEEFSILALLNHEISTLSSGEMRKVFLVKTLLQKPKLLILDEPFNGLDAKSRKAFVRFLDKLVIDLQIVLVTQDLSEIPESITHVMVIEGGKIASEFKKAEFQKLSSPTLIGDPVNKGSIFNDLDSRLHGNDKQTIIHMKNVSVIFGKKKVLLNINWTVREGENWAILGPNGAGKSTLVKLITGDSLQVHANDISIFGKRRDELTLWDLRKNLGYISSEMHLQGKNLHLSQGQKRMALIEREFKKTPKILILDEPCQHLDQKNKNAVLAMIDKIGRSGKTNILLITHHEDEIVQSIDKILRLKDGKIVIK